MIYKLHYWFFASGANVFSILIGVFVETYTDASPSELGTLLMVIPFLSIVFRPIICSVADRERAHRKYMLACLLVVAISYSPFVIIPFLGPDIYRGYARSCWYIFMLLKVIGDVAFGGASSIGDSLAINYAKRIGTSFTVYRVWGTISWMFFGILIGQVNEVEFMPRYVPGFCVLITASLLDAFCIWLWPEEYFEMGSTSESCCCDGEKNEPAAGEKTEDANNNELKKKKENQFTKSLMPKEVVWAQAKQKLLGLFCCAGSSAAASKASAKIGDTPQSQTATDNKLPPKDTIYTDKQNGLEGEIDKWTQLRILLFLLRRDPRIMLYLAYFTVGGATMSALSFFYISLSDICHRRGTCDFSQLAGLLQVSMSALETLVFIYIGRWMAWTGRVNMAAIAMLLAAIKFSFYGTIWPHVSPYYALPVESLHGLIFGIHLTLMVEMGHLFSGEVRFVIGELLECGIIDGQTDTAKLRYSLAATMQALISTAADGFGRGLGALAFGLLLERISFESLWLLIGTVCFVLFAVTLAINMVGTLLGLRLGLDVKANDEIERRKLAEAITAAAAAATTTSSEATEPQEAPARQGRAAGDEITILEKMV